MPHTVAQGIAQAMPALHEQILADGLFLLECRPDTDTLLLVEFAGFTVGYVV